MSAVFKCVPFSGLPDYSAEEMQKRAESFKELMEGRRTIRDFCSKPVDRAVIETAVATAGLAPSGANKQPWHFAVISNPEMKRKIREAAEIEEREFYSGKASEQWLKDLEPLGTDPHKPFLEIAPYLIVVFQQNYDLDPETGDKIKHYYIQESVGLACGFLITALHNAGLATLTHTPSPMGFLRELLGRPKHEKPVMIIVTGHPAEDATVPLEALNKKDLDRTSSWFE
ncbi:nitroreductase family protein [Kiloniella laminariae]|uniref:Nitroreductase family protein n=1 Tax=Kiloniella laminariae TaxID=454162 RepID=A0ABT4LNB6_9PROT|nr:nitroreductase family protein [Kiloniella laminariae]MCZ4281821.1 nitroreductase family protein [Kiloniella laminariae]